MIEHFESLGMSLLDNDGQIKTIEALQQEEIDIDLQRRAEAGLKK
jgi:hypothetical protein